MEDLSHVLCSCTGPSLTMTELGTAACPVRDSVFLMGTSYMLLMPQMMNGGRQG